MRSITKIGIIIVLLAGVAAGYRLYQIYPYPYGPGVGNESPDALYTAYASSLSDGAFFQEEFNYYEFTIQNKQGQVVKRVTMDAPREGFMNLAEKCTIEWFADSSGVTYSFPGVELILKTTTKK